MSGVWNRNYSNAMAYWFTRTGTAPTGHAGNYSNDNLSIKLFNGNLFAVDTFASYTISLPTLSYPAYRVPNQRSSSAGGSGGFICLGTGTTEPTFEDYNIESPISAFTLSQSNIVVDKYVYDSTSHTYKSTIRFVCQYTGSSPVTVSEMVIGSYAGVPSYQQYTDAIAYREVFDTPIVVNQYESVIIELSITELTPAKVFVTSWSLSSLYV